MASTHADLLSGYNSSESTIDEECGASSFLSNSPANISPTNSGSSTNSNGSLSIINRHCGLCNDVLVNLKVLSCLHRLCKLCLERNQEHADKLICPICKEESLLPCKDMSELLPGLAAKFVQHDSLEDPSDYCSSCKDKKSFAVYHCYDCNHYLCSNCVVFHKFIHRVVPLSSKKKSENRSFFVSLSENIFFCPYHATWKLKYFCKTCSVLACQKCTSEDHPPTLHDCVHLSELDPKVAELLNQTIQESKAKALDISNIAKTFDNFSVHLQGQYNKAQKEVYETYHFYCSLLEERKEELLKELESVFTAKQMTLNTLSQKAAETVEKIYHTCNFYETLTKNASAVECLMLKNVIDSKLRGMTFNVNTNLLFLHDLEFVSNYQAIQVGVRNTFGYVRSISEDNLRPSMQPPIARPDSGLNLLGSTRSSTPLHGLNSYSMPSGLNVLADRQFNNVLTSLPFEPNDSPKRNTPSNTMGLLSTSMNNINVDGVISYQKWSNGSELFKKDALEQYSLALSNKNDSTLDVNSPPIFSPKLPIKRQKMTYQNKFGEFGVLEGQFTEPSGVAVNAQNEIIVADTNNHRIQVFDMEGRFKFTFGECGKRDGQLLYPNRLTVMKTSGDIIVTERSPTHQIQIYNHYGQFVRKFGANILQHPRGVTVDNKGRIIVVECKVMRVIIFDQNGKVLQKFGCSKHLEFPNDVVVNDNQEIFISDNRAHSVKVFNYDGVFLRQIGHSGLTNYPIGVAINHRGEILIADNHNNFNVSVFSQRGDLLGAFESKVKHAQCFSIALLDDGSVVLASKDYRIYVYRFASSSVPPISA